MENRWKIICMLQDHKLNNLWIEGGILFLLGLNLWSVFMMIALVVIFAVFGYASSTELLCQCPPTYGPMKIHGSVRCANPLTFHIIPCTYTNKEPECVCYKDYDSQQVNGKTYCINKHFFHILPCNTFMQPTCDCINYTEIQIGSDGVPKCALHVGEKVAKTWACENSDEWDKFYELP